MLDRTHNDGSGGGGEGGPGGGGQAGGGGTFDGQNEIVILNVDLSRTSWM